MARPRVLHLPIRCVDDCAARAQQRLGCSMPTRPKITDSHGAPFIIDRFILHCQVRQRARLSPGFAEIVRSQAVYRLEDVAAGHAERIHRHHDPR